MRLAVLSDIHGNSMALEAVLVDIEKQGVPDAYWVLGDLVAFGPRPREALECLRSLPRASFTRGNTDRYIATGERPIYPFPIEGTEDWALVPETLRQRDALFRWTAEQLGYEEYSFLRDLPCRVELDVPGYGRALGVHASAEADDVGISPKASEEELRAHLGDIGARLLLCGHTHMFMHRKLGDRDIINAGSVGLPLDGDQRASYGLLELEGERLSVVGRRVSYNVNSVMEQLRAIDHPWCAWVISRLERAASPRK